MKRIFQLFPFALLVLVTLPFAVLPYRIALRVGDALGLIIFFFWRSRRAIALQNLCSAVDRGAITLDRDPQTVIRQNFRHFGKFIIEVIKIYYGFSGSMFRTVEVRGEQIFRKAQEKGKGVICITGHCGNWELLAVYVSMHITRLNVVARRQNNEYINRFIEKTREKYGNSIFYKEGALKRIFSSLRKNETVGILMDQSVVRSEGLVIPFLGKNAYTMKAPAIIARKTGASVISCFIRRTEKGHVIEVGEEIPLDASDDYDTAVLRDTINFSRPIEEYIRKYPENWLWIHRRWKRSGG